MDQQKILGYFIEEAKEHLETLEKGLLELSSVVKDQERLNEMFRAAHSIKGGAAMLGYGSIQKIAHRLEDAFKILRENAVPVDQKLESLFLKGYDVLHDLVEKLQSRVGLKADEADVIVKDAAPFFVELQAYLNQIVTQDPPHLTTVTDLDIPSQVRSLLKEMLTLFKGEATLQSRRSLQKLCSQLAQLAPKEKGWQTLTKTASEAIGNPQHSYRTLATVIIQELKQGVDYIELGKSEKISTSQELQQLATSQLPHILISLDPQAIANVLHQIFNQQQISQLMQCLNTQS
ncbi:Hpt domain-containing protein [Aphanothece sacrum]|uniref:HPt domain-containing protein n=1 Tax=Aphanothece sacrum FPU1 TaxID=1920663 RepID=A0A401IE03_APHSA|nr:Hpt domain-containing protein [Aphanothece sacrum]GBF79466.1 hypothetical protein AsFPU1_0861 [Aphanothece sacrum FPU1]GBF85814.1 hypothetical protein AsFPU3_2880 [Aphanothece sacrum FPU3]